MAKRINGYHWNGDKKSPVEYTQEIDNTVGGGAEVQAAADTGDAAFPAKHQRAVLSDSCSNKVCHFWEYALSCKAFDFGVSRTCAKYYMGYTFDCPTFPRAKEMLDAPSACLPELFQFLAVLVNPFTFVDYLTKFEESACDRNCYQNYQNYSREFFLDCYEDIYGADGYGDVLQLTYAAGFFQQFRNQACSAQPTTDLNCYTAVLPVLAASSAGGTDEAQAALNFECNYFNQTGASFNATIAASNEQVLQTTCAGFQSVGCCAGSGIALVQQNQVGIVKGAIQASITQQPVDVTALSQITPPCLLNYINSPTTCPGVDLTDLCQLNSVADQTTMTGVISLPAGTFPQAALSFPNMYEKTDVISFMGVVTSTLAAFPGFAEQPYIFNSGYPFQVTVIGFEYYDGGTLLTPTDGTMFYPPQGDYEQATSGNFTYQLVVQNLDDTEAATLYATLSNTNFQAAIAGAYTGEQDNSAVSCTSTGAPLTYDKQPRDVDNGGISSASPALLPALISSLLCGFFLFSRDSQRGSLV